MTIVREGSFQKTSDPYRFRKIVTGNYTVQIEIPSTSESYGAILTAFKNREGPSSAARIVFRPDDLKGLSEIALEVANQVERQKKNR